MKTNSYIEWYNENEGRSYPISESASGVSDAGDSLPNSIITDLSVMVPTAYADVYITSVRVTPTFITIGISCPTTGLLVGTFLRNSIRPHKAYPLTAVVPSVSGWIAFGTYPARGTEDYRFSSLAQSALEVRAVKLVHNLPVSKIIRRFGSATEYATGIVKLVAGSGVTIKQDLIDDQLILVGLAANIQYTIVGPCNDTAPGGKCGVPLIRSIAGVCPDENGKITLRFE